MSIYRNQHGVLHTRLAVKIIRESLYGKLWMIKKKEIHKYKYTAESAFLLYLMLGMRDETEHKRNNYSICYPCFKILDEYSLLTWQKIARRIFFFIDQDNGHLKCKFVVAVVGVWAVNVGAVVILCLHKQKLHWALCRIQIKSLKCSATIYKPLFISHSHITKFS